MSPDTDTPADGPHPRLWSEVRAMPPPVWILLAGTLVNRFGSFVLVFLVLYLVSEGYSPVQAGAATSVYGIGSMLAGIVGGHLADRVGRRETIALSMFSAAVLMVSLYRADGLVAIVAITGALGFAGELYRPASAALLTDHTPAGRRVPAFALYRLAINIGTAFGPAVGGLLATRSFGILFVGDALTCAAFGLVALVLLPKTRPHVQTGVVATGAFRTILADRAFLVFLIAAVAGSWVFMQASSTYPLQLEAYGYSTALYGSLLGLNGLLVVLFELPLTGITRRHPPRRVMGAGLALFGIGFGMTGMVSSWPLLVVAVVIWTLGEMLHLPVASAYVADLAPAHMRGRYQGAFSLSFGISLVLAPALGTALFEWDAGALWGICLWLGLLAAAIVSLPVGSRAVRD